MIEKKMPSGAKLEINLAPFKDAKNLQKAIAAELKGLKLDANMNVEDINLIKDIVCTAIASDKIMEALEVCMKRCAYNGPKIDDNTFEDEKARGDYLIVCSEILKANIAPFMSGLSSAYKDFAIQRPVK